MHTLLTSTVYIYEAARLTLIGVVSQARCIFPTCMSACAHIRWAEHARENSRLSYPMVKMEVSLDKHNIIGREMISVVSVGGIAYVCRCFYLDLSFLCTGSGV